ncbi:MAG: Gfo/Idh/MocA family protein, partial [Candidatus Limnocylindria bacterium]
MRRPSDIGAAVIGSGFIGTVHIEALRRMGVQVHGLLGSSAERAATRARELGVPHGYASLAELLADDRVEVVHVTSPNHLHHQQVCEILASGRHVVCEKPLALTSEQSRELVSLAAESGRVNAVNFNIRFYPLNQHAHEMVSDGALGDVRLVTGRYFQDWLLLETDWNWRLEPDRGGALRAVGDIGSHWLDLLTFVTGLRITEVMADLATFIPARRQPAGPVETFSTERATDTVEREIATEDIATILLRFENGARGSVAISQLSPGRKNSLQYEIDGSNAAAFWDSEQPDQMWIGHRERSNEIFIRNPALMGPAGQAAAAVPGGHVEGFADSFRALFRSIYADIGTGAPAERPGYPTFADGHDEMLVGDAVAA